MAFGTDGGLVPSTVKTGVQFVRNDLALMFPDYDLVEACLIGPRAVKDKRQVYLPMPDAINQSEENKARYEAYLIRSVFYNVTQRTALGLQGQIFIRPPIVEAPTALENVVTDSNGGGISLEQLARDACWYVIGYGRAGLFTDYPPVTAPVSRADMEAGNIRPTITVYGPKNIINWRTKVIGSKTVLCLVVLRETYILEDDGFETKEAVQYRELRLDEENKYTVQLWRAKSITGDDFEKFGAPYQPKDGKGADIAAIPFTFIGSKNNEPCIDLAPLLDLANINIAHYRNSADYEEMVYIIGQPMLTISGLTQEWYENVLNKRIPFGSRAGLPLPEGAKGELLQVQENTAAFEAMQHKERQMVSLGAKLVEQNQVQRTATEAGLENAGEESVLSAIAKNVSVAMQWALEWCALFINVSETGIKYQLNTDFEFARMSTEQINGVIKSWQDEAISWTEMRTMLRKAGRTSQTDEEAKTEIEADQTAAIEKAAAEIGATTLAVHENTPAIPE